MKGPYRITNLGIELSDPPTPKELDFFPVAGIIHFELRGDVMVAVCCDGCDRLVDSTYEALLAKFARQGYNVSVGREGEQAVFQGGSMPLGPHPIFTDDTPTFTGA